MKVFLTILKPEHLTEIITYWVPIALTPCIRLNSFLAIQRRGKVVSGNYYYYFPHYGINQLLQRPRLYVTLTYMYMYVDIHVIVQVILSFAFKLFRKGLMKDRKNTMVLYSCKTVLNTMI